MVRSAVVVGAGVGGLATALGLHAAGWRVTVQERRAEVAQYGNAFGIHPTAQNALERLGLGAELAAHGVPYRHAGIRRPDGRLLAELPLERIERRAGRPELLLSRPRLVSTLLTALGAQGGSGGVALEFGAPAVDVAALCEAHDLVVGADGIGSTVRTACFGERSRPRQVDSVAWIGVADFETASWGETWGAGRFFGRTPIAPGHTNWYATVPSAATPDELRAHFDGWHDPIPRLLDETDQATWFRYELRHLYPALPSFVLPAGGAVERAEAGPGREDDVRENEARAKANAPALAGGWGTGGEESRGTRRTGDGASGRGSGDATGGGRGAGAAGVGDTTPVCRAGVALVGDAAHAMTPNLGQGACTALLDAEALARAVAVYPDRLDEALRAYDRERRRAAQRVAFGSRTLHRFMASRHPRLRNSLLRLLA